MSRTGIDALLGAARGRPAAPHAGAGALRRGCGRALVDIRPSAQRVQEGEIPGALVIERNVLEWRFDPTSTARLPQASVDLRVVVLCSEGYTSSLAAAALHDVGVPLATDLAGGVAAWRSAGLPLVPGGTPAGQISGTTVLVG